MVIKRMPLFLSIAKPPHGLPLLKFSNIILGLSSFNLYFHFIFPFKNCKFVLQKKQNGTADAVLSAKKYLKRNLDILILFGDSPLLTISTLRKLSHNYFKKKMLGLMLAFN